MNKPVRILFIICLLASVSGRGQMYYTNLEVGVSAGVSQYFGDLNEHHGINTIHFAGGFCARQRMNSYIALKAVANYTKVGYSDTYNSTPFEKQRNLSFESEIIEFAAQAEFNFFAYVTGVKEKRWTPFLTGGIGMFYYDPYTEYQGKKTYLRPLGTEGQYAGYAGRKYTTTSPCFPIGAGVKFWIKGGINIIFEVADRLTTTDYLDDVSSTYVGINKFKANSVASKLQDRSGEGGSGVVLGAGKQRGNTASKDQYMMAMVSITFNFQTYHCPRGVDDDLKVR